MEHVGTGDHRMEGGRNVVRIKPAVFILGVLLGFAIYWILFSRNDQPVTSTFLEPRSSFKVYLITMDKQDRHWYTLNQGAADMAALLGINYVWDAPENKDTTKQIEIIYKAVEDGANLILLAANDPVAVSNAIEDAKAKSVKFIYVDSPAYEEAIVTLATNNYSAGMTAGETMLSELEGVGILNGSVGIIGVSTATNSTMNRELGFREALEKDGRYRLLDTEYQNGDPTASEQAAAKLITEHPELVGLFGTNEGSTIGVGNAIKGNNPNLIGIGFDRSPDILALIRDGSLRAAIAQNPYTMGYLGMAEAYAALTGLDTGPPEINTGVSLLRRRN
jgi:ribose transport system substrate-binding protein